MRWTISRCCQMAAESPPLPEAVGKPPKPEGCWCKAPLNCGPNFPKFSPCLHNARPGYLTCWHHRKREQDAQTLRTMSGV